MHDYLQFGSDLISEHTVVVAVPRTIVFSVFTTAKCSRIVRYSAFANRYTVKL